MSASDPRSGCRSDLSELVTSHLRSAKSSWSIGAFGAIAEFHRGASEPVELGELSAVTQRGAIAVTLLADTLAIDHESGITLCLPEAGARMSARTGIASLGRDREALRAQDREALLFDLGLGLASCEFCVRSADPALVDALRAAENTALLANPALVALLKRASPHRVVRSRAGRIEVYQDIAADDGTSPAGPHTHLLPHLLKQGRAHAAGVPIPDGRLPCLTLYPPGRAHVVEGHERS